MFGKLFGAKKPETDTQLLNLEIKALPDDTFQAETDKKLVGKPVSRVMSLESGETIVLYQDAEIPTLYDAQGRIIENLIVDWDSFPYRGPDMELFDGQARTNSRNFLCSTGSLSYLEDYCSEFLKIPTQGVFSRLSKFFYTHFDNDSSYLDVAKSSWRNAKRIPLHEVMGWKMPTRVMLSGTGKSLLFVREVKELFDSFFKDKARAVVKIPLCDGDGKPLSLLDAFAGMDSYLEGKCDPSYDEEIATVSSTDGYSAERQMPSDRFALKSSTRSIKVTRDNQTRVFEGEWGGKSVMNRYCYSSVDKTLMVANEAGLHTVDCSRERLDGWTVTTHVFPFRITSIRQVESDPNGNYLMVSGDQSLWVLDKKTLAVVHEVKDVQGPFTLNKNGVILYVDTKQRMKGLQTNFSKIDNAAKREQQTRSTQALKGIKLKDLLADTAGAAKQVANGQPEAKTVDPVLLEMGRDLHQGLAPEIKGLKNLEQGVALRERLAKVREGLRGQISATRRDWKPGELEEAVNMVLKPAEDALRGQEENMAQEAVDAQIVALRRTLKGTVTLKLVSDLRGGLTKIDQAMTHVSNKTVRDTALEVQREVDEAIAGLFRSQEGQIVQQVQGTVDSFRAKITVLDSLRRLDEFRDFEYPQIRARLGVFLQECPLECTKAREAITAAMRDLHELTTAREEALKSDFKSIRSQAAESIEHIARLAKEEVLRFVDLLKRKGFATRDEAERWAEGSDSLVQIRSEITTLRSRDADKATELDQTLKVELAQAYFLIEQQKRSTVNAEGRQMVMFGDVAFPLWERSSKQKPLKIVRRVIDEIVPPKQKEPELNGSGNVPEWSPHWVMTEETQEYLKSMATHLNMQSSLQEGSLNLVGHAGTGKDVLVKMFAHLTNRRYFPIDCSKWTTEFELSEDIQVESVDGATQTLKVPSVVMKGITTPGAIMYFNEFNGMPEQAQIFLHALFDEKRTLTLKTSSGKIVKADPSVLFASSMNPGYPGTYEPQMATRSRMMDLRVNYPRLQEKSEASSPYLASEAMMVARGVNSLRDLTLEPDLARNAFVQVWNAHVNVMGTSPIPLSAEQIADLNVILALVQFAAKLRADFMKHFEKSREARTALPVRNPITLREMRRMAYALSKMTPEQKKDPDATAMSLLFTYFLCHMDQSNDVMAIKEAMCLWHSQKRIS